MLMGLTAMGICMFVIVMLMGLTVMGICMFVIVMFMGLIVMGICRVISSEIPSACAFKFFTEKFTIAQPEQLLIYADIVTLLLEGFFIQISPFSDQVFGIDDDLSLTAEILRNSIDSHTGIDRKIGLRGIFDTDQVGSGFAALGERCFVI